MYVDCCHWHCSSQMCLWSTLQYPPLAMPGSGLYLKEPDTGELDSDLRSATNQIAYSLVAVKILWEALLDLASEVTCESLDLLEATYLKQP